MIDFSGVVLAGGKSRRMGFPKHLIELDGVPLWRRQMDLLRLAGARSTALSLAAAQPSPGMDLKIVRDVYPACGPLGGIAAALAWSQEPFVFVLAVDLPSMMIAAASQIVAACTDSLGCVPCLETGTEPLAAVYPKAALSLAVKNLETGRLAARSFVDDCVASGLMHRLAITERKSFQNMNRPTSV